HQRCLPPRSRRCSIHNGFKVPLVTRPSGRSIHFDVCVHPVHPYLLHVRTLLLVKRQKICPSHNRCGPAAIHNRNIFAIKLVQLFDIADLPRAKIFAQHVINLLLVRQRHHRIGVVVVYFLCLILFLLFVVLPLCPWRSQRHRKHQCHQNRGSRPHFSSSAKSLHKLPPLRSSVNAGHCRPKPPHFHRVRDLLLLLSDGA